MMTLKELTATWNDLHIRFSKENAETRNDKMADWCELTLLEAKVAYYKIGTPIMSDENYDKIEERLRILRPESTVLEKVGS